MIDINPVERGYYIKVRGMENVLIQPKSETRRAVFQQSTTQTCVVNQIRNSCKHVVWKVMREFSADMKEIYTSVNRDQAAVALEHFEQKWRSKYSHAAQS